MLDTVSEKKMDTIEDIADRLWLTVEDLHEFMQGFSEPDGLCLKWTGQRDGRGYGRMKRRQGDTAVVVPAHRIAYAMHIGPLIEDAVVLHLCDNKLCVNPNHLVMGTQKANMYDLQKKGLAAHGCKHPASKLSEEQVNEIRVLYKYGYQQKRLAQMFGVARSTVSKVVTKAGYSRVA